MSNEEIIEEILMDAASIGLLDEVRETAKEIITNNPDTDRVTAYQMAFEEWVK